jgi:hypothetical protein
VTFFGLFLTPVFYVAIRAVVMRMRRKHWHAKHGDDGHGPDGHAGGGDARHRPEGGNSSPGGEPVPNPAG